MTGNFLGRNVLGGFRLTQYAKSISKLLISRRQGGFERLIQDYDTFDLTAIKIVIIRDEPLF